MNISKRKKLTPLKFIVFIFLILWCISFFGSFSWVLINSFKDRIQYLLEKIALPKPFLFKNYIDAFTELQTKGKSMIFMVVNSFWLTLGTILLQMITSCMFAYAVAKYKFFGRNFLYWAVIIRLILPIAGALPATYKLYQAIGIYDSPLLLISRATGISNFIILYACYKGLSWSYAESAFIDGAGHFRVFLQIMLPQMSGILIALSVGTFIAVWNDYMTPILFLPSFPTIASGIFSYQQETIRKLNTPILFAASIMSIIPVVVLFAVFQKHFLNIDISGGLKG